MIVLYSVSRTKCFQKKKEAYRVQQRTQGREHNLFVRARCNVCDRLDAFHRKQAFCCQNSGVRYRKEMTYLEADTLTSQSVREEDAKLQSDCSRVP